jgi:hypothetical protein
MAQRKDSNFGLSTGRSRPVEQERATSRKKSSDELR